MEFARGVWAGVAVIICVVQLGSSAEYVKVCEGTKSSLGYSHQGSDKIYKRMFENCTHVDGNLEIVYLDKNEGRENATHNYDLSFLSTIREVSGYVLLFGLHAEIIPLTSLRVIRGQSLYMLYDTGYSLYVSRNYQPNTTGIGIKEIRMPNLREVMRGSVAFTDNYELCFIDTIDWNDTIIGKNAKFSLQLTTSRLQRTCEKCDASCGTRGCWGTGPNMCQTLSRQCARQCDGSCYGPLPNDCCRLECVGGCTGPTRADCWACRNYLDNGACVESCPPPFIFDQSTRRQEKNPDVRYMHGTVCVEKCPVHMIVDLGACVSSCGEGRAAENGECVPCGRTCPKQCNVIDNYINANNIGNFTGCTIITGTVRILQTTFNSTGRNSPINVSQLSVFENVEEITGALVVEADYPGFTDLTFFKNLRIIQGRELDNGAALKVLKTSLKKLGLQSLKSIPNGRVFIGLNPYLCYADSINWTSGLIAANGGKVIKNGSGTHCGNCSKHCSSDGCWGPGSDECVSCAVYKRAGQCVDSCDLSNRLYINITTQECNECHEECLNSCEGPGSDECDACKHVKDGTYCKSQCPNMFYADPESICHPCSPTCIQNCTGPLDNLAQDGCSACDVVVYNLSKAKDPSYCLMPNSDCPNRFYSKIVKDSLTQRRYIQCRPCYHLCSKCFDSGRGSCEECDAFWQGDDCVVACSDDHYLDETSKPQCKPCSEMCAHCNGPTLSECTVCRYVTIYSDLENRHEPNAQFNCSETCPDWAPAQLQENRYNHTITVCVTEAYMESLHNHQSRGKVAGAVVGGVIGAIVLVGLVVIIVMFLRRQAARAEENKTRILDDYMGAGKIEPLSPTAAKPDMSQLKIVKESELRLGDIIGSGAFGTVYRGIWVPAGENVKIPVAIKVLREDSSAKQSVELLEEARIMASVIHPNCVRVAGVCMTAQMMLILPLMPLGCLLEYIRKNRSNVGSVSLLNWCAQIARGMEYLEQRGIVHRDLAARNVLVQSSSLVKITDFGLSKMLDHDQELFKATGGKLPVKWLALESIQHHIFTHKSDVWSYGVTIWELMTYGQRPYDTVRALDMLDFLEKGERLPQPPICTIDVYMIMVNCWLVDADGRPTFRKLNEDFTRMARDPGRYLVIQGDDLMRLPLLNTNPKDLLSDLGSSVDGPEEAVTADDYLQPKQWKDDDGKGACGDLDDLVHGEYGSPKKGSVKAGEKYGSLETESEARKGRAKQRRKNSRYTSDPCRANKDSVGEQSELLPKSPDRPPTVRLDPESEKTLPVDEDDYLKPSSGNNERPSYMDIVSDEYVQPMTETNPEYFENAADSRKSVQAPPKQPEYCNVNSQKKPASVRPFSESQV